MPKEVLAKLPQTPSAEKIQANINILLTAGQNPEAMADFWRKRDFVSTVPKIIQTLISSQSRHPYSEENRALIFSSLFMSFMQADWTPRSRAIATGSLNFTNDGKIKTSTPGRGQSAGTIKNNDSLFRAALGSVLLLGLTLNNRKSADDIIHKAYSDASASKQENFCNHLFALLQTNSSTRQWIIIDKLDQGIDKRWGREMAKLVLFLKYRSNFSKKQLAHGLPKELVQYDIGRFYPDAVIDEFLSYILEYMKNISTIRNNRIDLGTLTGQLAKLESKSYGDPDLQAQILDKIQGIKYILDSATQRPR